MTHAELVKRAEKWLRSTMKCGVVLAERRSNHTSETPDAIGWRHGLASILVECKASRDDFRRDKDKHFRAEYGMGMGQRRFYMAKPYVIDIGSLPDGWGLLEVHGRTVRVAREATVRPFEAGICANELPLLVSAMRRVQLGIEPTFGCALDEARLTDVARARLKAALDAIHKAHESEAVAIAAPAEEAP